MNSGIIQKRLKEAYENLSEAKIVKEAKISNLAVLTKLYHAMIYAIMALFEIEDIGTLTHEELIERLNKEYVSKGLLKYEFLEALKFAYEYTHECDCAEMKEPQTSDIEYLQPLAEEFVNAVSKILGVS